MKLGASCPKMSFFIPERGIFSKNGASFLLFLSSSLSKEKDTKSPLIWHLFLTTNDRGAMDLITRNEKSVRGLDCKDSIGKMTGRGLDCHDSIGKVTSRGLSCHESIGKVASRGLDCHDSIGKITGRDLSCHDSIRKVTGRGLGHYKTSLNTNN